MRVRTADQRNTYPVTFVTLDVAAPSEAPRPRLPLGGALLGERDPDRQ